MVKGALPRQGEPMDLPIWWEELIEFFKAFVTERRLALFESTLDYRTRHLTVLLEDVADPHDACAVMRSCDCFGVQDVHLVNRDGPFKASAGVAVGATKWIGVQNYNGKGDLAAASKACLSALKSQGYRVVGLSTKSSSVAVNQLPLDQKTVLCMAMPGQGLSDTILENCEQLAHLPTVGFGGTYNISVCAALVLSSLTGRLRESSITWQLDSGERQRLLLVWLSKMTKRFQPLLTRFMEERSLTKRDFQNLALPPELVSKLS